MPNLIAAPLAALEAHCVSLLVRPDVDARDVLPTLRQLVALVRLLEERVSAVEAHGCDSLPGHHD